jgi:hypothetical protein
MRTQPAILECNGGWRISAPTLVQGPSLLIVQAGIIWIRTQGCYWARFVTHDRSRHIAPIIQYNSYEERLLFQGVN